MITILAPSWLQAWAFQKRTGRIALVRALVVTGEGIDWKLCQLCNGRYERPAQQGLPERAAECLCCRHLSEAAHMLSITRWCPVLYLHPS